MEKCSIDGCVKTPRKYRSVCSMHEARIQRHGDANYTRPKVEISQCTAPSCERKVHAGKFCSTHYMKIKRTGTLDRITDTPETKARRGYARRTELTHIDSTPDPKNRGFLAVNIVNDLKYKAGQRKIPWELTPIEAYRLITDDCRYCGAPSGWPITRNGIDRQVNTVGYRMTNCVACCKICNSSKGTMSLDEFFTWIERVQTRISLLQEAA